MSACAPPLLHVDPRRLAKLLQPHRGGEKALRRTVHLRDMDGHAYAKEVRRYALITLCDGRHSVTVVLETLRDLLRLLPSPVALLLADDGLTLTWANGCAVLDPHVSAQATVPAVDVAPAQVPRK